MKTLATLGAALAIGGGSHYIITSTHQIKPSVLAQLHGQAGPAGAPGATGAPGAPGPQGPAGSIDWTREYQVSTTGAGYAIASCRPGDHVVTGGFYVEDATILQSSPVQQVGGQGWEAIDQPSSGGGVTVFAECAP